VLSGPGPDQQALAHPVGLDWKYVPYPPGD